MIAVRPKPQTDGSRGHICGRETPHGGPPPARLAIGSPPGVAGRRVPVRNRGIVGRVIADEQITGPYESYALFVRPDGEMLMVQGPEGVGYRVRTDKPWKWNDYNESCPSYGPEELLEARTDKEVDLADWIRVFGARLESNFAQIVHWWNS